MWVTGADHSYFVSFDPRIDSNTRLHFIKVEKDEVAIEASQKTVIRCIALRDEILEEFKTGKRLNIPVMLVQRQVR